MARKVRLIVFAVLAALVMCFIFSNSLQGSVESNAKSGWVAAFLRPILNPFGWLEEEAYHKLVRKLAHFAEFGLLGLCLGGVAANVSWKRKWCFAAGAGVLTACIDETIQSFTGRTNSLKDVCIDSVGAACGLVFVWLVLRGIKRYKERRS